MGKAKRKRNPGSTSGAPVPSGPGVTVSRVSSHPRWPGSAGPRSEFLLVSGKLKAKRKEKAHGEGPWF